MVSIQVSKRIRKSPRINKNTPVERIKNLASSLKEASSKKDGKSLAANQKHKSAEITIDAILKKSCKYIKNVTVSKKQRPTKSTRKRAVSSSNRTFNNSSQKFLSIPNAESSGNAMNYENETSTKRTRKSSVILSGNKQQSLRSRRSVQATQLQIYGENVENSAIQEFFNCDKSSIDSEKRASPYYTRRSSELQQPSSNNPIQNCKVILNYISPKYLPLMCPEKQESRRCTRRSLTPAQQSSNKQIRKPSGISIKQLLPKSLTDPKKQMTPRCTRRPLTLIQQSFNKVQDSSFTPRVLRTPICKPLTNPEEQDTHDTRSLVTPRNMRSSKYKAFTDPEEKVSPRRTRRSLKLVQPQTLHENSLNIYNIVKKKSAKSTKSHNKQGSVKPLSTKKNSSTPEEQRLSADAQSCFVTPIKPTKRIRKSLPTPSMKQLTREKTGYLRKPFETYPKRARRHAKSATLIDNSVIMYQKNLENIPIDNLSLKLSNRKVKSVEFKVPGKNTLKRKRQSIAAAKNADDDYEDDIYESRNFENFKDLFVSGTPVPFSFSTPHSSMSTPQLGLPTTPFLHAKTPTFKDCFSPRELALQRKVAEECYYRNKKRKSGSTSNTKSPEAPEKKKLEFEEVISEANKVQKTIEKITGHDDSVEDDYFFDLSFQNSG